MPTYLSPGVYVEEVPAGSRPIEGVGTSVAAFVGLAAKGPINEPKLVSNWTQFTEAFGEFVENSYLAHAVYGWFLNGGGNCFVVRIAADSGNGSRPKAIEAPKQASIGGYTATSIAKGATASKNIRVSVEQAGGESPPDDEFKLVVLVDGKSTETYDNVTTRPGDNNVATKVNAASKIINLEETNPGSALTPIAKGQVDMAAPEATPVPPSTDNLGTGDYVGDAAERTGFGGLEAVEEVTMVAVPDLAAALENGAIDLEHVQGRAAGDDRALRADGRPDRDPRHPSGAERAGGARVAHPGCGLRLEVRRAVLAVGPGLRPGVGHQQVRATVRPHGAVSGRATTTPAACTRRPPTRWCGVRSRCRPRSPRPSTTCSTRWASTASGPSPAAESGCGARGRCRVTPSGATSTCAGSSTTSRSRSSPAPSGSCSSRTTTQLWARIRRTISAFLVNEWRKGALFGTTPDEAFFVKCDDETNPAEGIDAGQVVCQIGVAPVKPAEFVIFQLSQFSGGTSLVSE